MIAGLARLAGLFFGLVMAFSYYVPLTEYANKQWHLENKMMELFFQFGQPGLRALEKLPSLVVHRLVEIVAFLLIFFVVSLLTCWVGSMIAYAARWTFFRPADRLGGLILGFLRGVVLVLIFLALLVPLQTAASALPDGCRVGWLGGALEQSALVPIFWQFLVKLQLLFPGLPLKIGTVV